MIITGSERMYVDALTWEEFRDSVYEHMSDPDLPYATTLVSPELITTASSDGEPVSPARRSARSIEMQSATMRREGLAIVLSTLIEPPSPQGFKQSMDERDWALANPGLRIDRSPRPGMILYAFGRPAIVSPAQPGQSYAEMLQMNGINL